MNRRTGFLQVLLLVIVSLMFYGSLAQASLAEDVPETRILATIDEVTITQEEFNREISSLHRTMLEEGTDSVTAGRIDFPGVLQRLINLRLLALEARQIGLSEQPDFKRKMEKYREQQLKQKVLGNVVAENPITTDDEEVQTLYHRLSRELKIYDLLFDNEADAKEAATDIAKRGFVKVAEELKGAEHVQVSMDGGFLPLKELRGEVGITVIDMELDDVSPIFTTAGGYMIFQLLEIQQVDDEGVLAEAFAIESQRHNVKVKTEFLESLVEQYAQIDEQLLAAIDFSSSGPELAVLMADNRTLATLRVPGQPVALFSVAALTEAMSDKYYHGLEQARETKALNDAKESVLHKRLMTQLLLAEAQRLELLDSAEFKAQMNDYENRALFAEMVRKVIGPDVTFTKKEVDQYYAEHLAEYTTPRMIRLSSIPFSTVDNASHTVTMIRQGADFLWLTSNAPDQVRTDDAKLTIMRKKVVSFDGMPEEAMKALEGLSEGQSAWYTDEAGYIQVLYVDKLIPSKTKPLDEVRAEVEKAVFRQNVSKAVNEYAAKAKEHYQVKIYDPELRQDQSTWGKIKSFFD